MAVELVQRTSENLSGVEGRDLLVGQGAEIQEITAPESGVTKNISLGKGQTATLNFDATAATPLIEGNDFVLTFDTNGDGSADSRIVFQNLVEESQGTDAPVLVIGGVELSAGLLIGQAQALGEGETLETAAGADAGPTGGGGSQYNDNLGDVIDGLSALGTLGGTELEFGLLANGGDITDPAEGTFDVSFITTGTAVGEVKGGIEARDYDGGFEDWGPNQHIGNEGPAPMQVEFNFTPSDNETLDSIVIEALPENAVLYVGGSDAANIYSGPFPVTITPGDFDQVFIKPDTNSDVDLTLNVTANISDPDSGESTSIPVEVVAIIDAVADKPIFGNEGSLDGDGLVDLYLLQDLSGSFSDDVPNVQQAIADLIGKIKNGDFSADVHLGAGSFIDKAIGGLGRDGDYVYKNAQDVSADLDAVKAAVDAFTLGSGGDGPEAQIEALFNLAKNAADLGFREGATKYVVLTTDADFHKAGDALRLGKNDGDGDLTNDLDEDYPELAQLKAALEASGVVPVFMVTSDVKDTYKDLIDFLGRGKVLDLSSDSSDLLANLLKGISGPSDKGDNVYDEQAIVEVPVDVTFTDNDGSETHTIVLSNIPSDWIPQFPFTPDMIDGLGGENPGKIGLNTTYSITIDVTSLGENVDLNFEFNPQDWSSSRWSDGEPHNGGDAVIKIKAIAEETNTTDQELTTDNNRSESETTHTVKVNEDTPTVEEVHFSHDETDGVDAGTGDQASLNAGVVAALVASTVGEHGAVIGQAQGDVAFDFKTDGAGTPKDAADVKVESLQFEDYNGTPSGLYTGGDAAPVAITLHTDDANPNIVWGLDPSGNAVFAVHLGQPGTTSSGSVKMTFVQYGQINHDTDGSIPSDHNDLKQLVLKYRAVDDEGDASPYAEAKIDLKDDGPTITGSSSCLDEDKFVQGEYDLVNATDPVTITVTSADVSRAGFHNSIGFYVADANGNLIGGQIIVADGHSSQFAVGSDASVSFNKADYPDGATFGFFIVPNGGNKNSHLGGDYTDGADVTFVNVNGKLVPHINGVPVKGSGESAYFSNPTLNSDGAAHVYDNGHGGNYNWEDLRFPGSDADYSDLNLQIKVDGAKNAEAPVGGAVSGKLSFDVGTDVVGHKFEITGPSDLVSDGEVVTAGTPIISGSLIVIEGKTSDGDLVYKLTFDTKTGKYVYSQYRALDHNDPNGEVLPVKFGVKLIDGDGDTATADIVVNVKDSVPVVEEQVNTSVDEDSLPGATAIAEGEIDVDFGADGGEFTAITLDAVTDNNGDPVNLADLSSGGNPISIQLTENGDDLVLVGRADGKPVFDVYLNKETGDYTFRQFGALDHKGAKLDAALKLVFGYEVTDGDGDTDKGQLIVEVADSGPVIENTAAELDEGNFVQGVYDLENAEDTVTINIESAETSYAGHHNSIGFFVADANGNPIGGQIVQADAHSTVFKVGDDVSAIINKADYPNGVTFGFFTVPDGVDHNGSYFKDGAAVTFKNINGKWTAFIGNDEVKGAGESAYFSDPRLNSDGTTHVLDNDHEGNYNWEDLRFPYSDADYGDLNLKIDVDGASAGSGPVGGAVAGQMTFDIGADVSGHKFEIEGPTTLHANGVDVEATDPVISGSYITIEGRELDNGQPTGALVYKLVFNTTSGKYVYSQTKALDHNHPNGDSLPVKFVVKLTDGDGDTATASIIINVKDSTPVATDDIDSVTEDSGLVATGNVVTGNDVTSGDNNSTDGNADKLGADGFKSITWDEATGMIVGGLYGTLTVKDDGSYSYELNNAHAVVDDLNDGGVLKETFTYTVEDRDGDKSIAELVIDINGKTDVDPVPGAVNPWNIHLSSGTWDGDLAPDSIGQNGNSHGVDGMTLATSPAQGSKGAHYAISTNGDINGDIVASDKNDSIELSGGVNVTGGLYAHDGNDIIDLFHEDSGSSGRISGLIDGGEGNDIIIGGIYEDKMSGGSGNDTLTGGDGADIFVFKADSVGGSDIITDFDASEGDVLDLSALLSGFTAGTNSEATAVALKDYLSLSEDQGSTVVTIDHDGAGASNITTTIRLDNVDLLNGGSQDDAIKALLDSQKLIVE
ncbi:DUF5801 repeats-in-toxin domain-containing protein [Kiloniella sp. EL199]|uniref:DUF5801 repeats-in-toxin domain-containing protein n=1 Tax=Kiloniella sp. EL199 TaxID=2107581 RepID=UPI000EA3BDF6|nr:type I secretion C-terminal target domain-containing protein [Kiloniella sp. EL199]